MTTKNKDIKLGNLDLLPEDEFEPHHVKVRITTMLDEDILMTLKTMARARGVKYQTLLNNILRALLIRRSKNKKVLTESRIRSIVQEELRKRA